MPSCGSFALALTLLAGAPPSPSASPCTPLLHPRIAEILYDAAGDDTNREFVELFNPATTAFPLAGARLEAGDGSGAARWTLRWTGGAGDSVPALGRFVIGGSAVVPAPDRVADLALQNGPDAVRLAWPDGASEVVGYGALEFPEYYCGTPALDAPSGQSLARVPDDSDAGSNALDFRPASPSPGAANQPALDLALLAGSAALEPEQPAALASSRLTARVTNRGARLVAASAARLLAREVGALDTLAAAWLESALAPSETTLVALALPGLPAGKRRVALALALPGDEGPENDADTLSIRVGAGPLEITEIQFHPSADEGEWIEVRNRAGAPFPPAGLSMTDRHGTPGHAQGAAPLAAESLAVLAQDPTALLRRFPALDSTRVWAVPPWPSLNNSNGEGGIADAIFLREPDGTLIEHVDYSAAGVPAGVTIERRGGLWQPSPSPAGTPLEPPRAPPAIAGRFEVEPRRLLPGARPTLRWSLPWPRARAACEAYDLAGRKRGTLMAETLVPGRAERVADSSRLDPGVYVIVLRARPESGEDLLTLSRAMRVGGSR